MKLTKVHFLLQIGTGLNRPDDSRFYRAVARLANNETFSQPNVYLDRPETASHPWQGYVGGDIPEGLLVCRAPSTQWQYADHCKGKAKLASTWWIVHLGSGWPLTTTDYQTRKQALVICKAIGQEFNDVSWNRPAEEFTKGEYWLITRYSLHSLIDSLLK